MKTARLAPLLLLAGLSACTPRHGELLRTRQYHRGPGTAHGRPVYTEVQIRSVPFRPFGDDFEFCSLEPGAHPAAAVCSATASEGRLPRWYLVVPDATPRAIEISQRGWGHWIRSRPLYFVFHEWRLVHTDTGVVDALPNAPARGSRASFVTLSPDAAVALWSDASSPSASTLTFHLTRLADGHAVTTFDADPTTHPWMADFTHEEHPYGPSGWIADHFTWSRQGDDWSVTY